MAGVSEPSDEQRLTQLANELADGVQAALPTWVEAAVHRLLIAYSGTADPAVMESARDAGRAAGEDAGSRVRALLELDVDAQWTNPLALVRAAVAYPTQVLQDAAVPPVVRDELAERQFPDDVYDLTPTRFADLAPDLHEKSLAWGAAKAFIIKTRHKELGPT